MTGVTIDANQKAQPWTTREVAVGGEWDMVTAAYLLPLPARVKRA